MSSAKQIRNITPLSLGKVIGILYVCIGGIIGIVVACLLLIPIIIDGRIQVPIAFGIAVIGTLSISIIYGLLGWITGIATAYIYNLIAKRLGGIEIDIQ
jgi:hypothetical protein